MLGGGEKSEFSYTTLVCSQGFATASEACGNDAVYLRCNCVQRLTQEAEIICHRFLPTPCHFLELQFRLQRTLLLACYKGMLPIFFLSKACVRGRPAAEASKPKPER